MAVLRSNVMSRKSKTFFFFGFNIDLQAVVCDDFAHFVFDCFLSLSDKVCKLLVTSDKVCKLCLEKNSPFLGLHHL